MQQQDQMQKSGSLKAKFVCVCDFLRWYNRHAPSLLRSIKNTLHFSRIMETPLGPPAISRARGKSSQRYTLQQIAYRNTTLWHYDSIRAALVCLISGKVSPPVRSRKFWSSNKKTNKQKKNRTHPSIAFTTSIKKRSARAQAENEEKEKKKQPTWRYGENLIYIKMYLKLLCSRAIFFY